MRKLTLILCLFVTTTLQAQTKEETIAFLKTYYSALKDDKGFSSTIITYRTDSVKFNVCRAWKTSECSKFRTITIAWKDITAISYKHQEYKNFGDGSWETAGWRVTIITPVLNDGFIIHTSEEKGYVEKFKKALIKYAEYEGAKIVKEDLFGN